MRERNYSLRVRVANFGGFKAAVPLGIALPKSQSFGCRMRLRVLVMRLTNPTVEDLEPWERLDRMDFREDLPT